MICATEEVTKPKGENSNSLTLCNVGCGLPGQNNSLTVADWALRTSFGTSARHAADGLCLRAWDKLLACLHLKRTLPLRTKTLAGVGAI